MDLNDYSNQGLGDFMKKSIRTVLNKNIILFSIIIVSLLIYFTYVTILSLTFKIAENIAHESSSVISTEINTMINQEIYIAKNLSESESIIEWMKTKNTNHPNNDIADELSKYINDLKDMNIFIAIDNTREFFFIEDVVPEELNPKYILDKSLESDDWYFNTRDYIDDFDLNVDFDRNLKIMRIWINIKVEEDGNFFGIIGTGVELNPIVENIFAEEENYNSESLIFDSFGAIQLIRDVNKIQENSFGKIDDDKSIYTYGETDDFRSQIDEFIKNPSKNKIIDLEKNKSFMILSPIENTDWFMATQYNTWDIISFMDFSKLIVIVFALFIIFMFGINRIVKIKLILPIEKLNESLLNDMQYGLDREDEIGNLATTIANMNKQLKEYSNELEERYDKQTDLVNRFLDKAPVGVIGIDIETRVLSSNQHFRELIKTEKEVKLCDILIEEINLISELNSKGTLVIECEVQKENIWLELQILSVDTTMNMYELLVEDVTDKKKYEMELVKFASTDSLTGIYNRRQFEKTVYIEMQKLKYNGANLSLVLIDIDYFKLVNDQFGHAAGDRVLQEMTTLISEDLRNSDCFARWGGEEFVILLMNTDLNGARLKAERLRGLIESNEFTHNVRITASFGVAEFTSNKTYEEIFKEADAVLYHIKEDGRNGVGY